MSREEEVLGLEKWLMGLGSGSGILEEDFRSMEEDSSSMEEV